MKALPLLLVLTGSPSAYAQSRGGGGGGGGSLTCPGGALWGGYGNYCMNGSLYYCNYPGGQPNLISNCAPGYCMSNQAGTPDQCAYNNQNFPTPPRPTPTPTPRSTWNPYPSTRNQQCQRPRWTPSNSCDAFGTFRGQDLAAQVCGMGGGSSRGGGGQSTCQAWLEYECEQTFDATIQSCCPHMWGTSQATNVRGFCRF